MGPLLILFPQDSEEPNMQAVATIGLDIGLRRPLRSGFRALLDFFDRSLSSPHRTRMPAAAS